MKNNFKNNAKNEIDEAFNEIIRLGAINTDDGNKDNEIAAKKLPLKQRGVFTKIFKLIKRAIKLFLNIVQLKKYFSLKDLMMIRSKKISMSSAKTIVTNNIHSADPSATIIIPTYTKSDLLINAIASIHESKPTVTYEIVVVDNGNTPILEKLLNQSRCCRYIKPKENIGFVGGCNLGAKNAKGDFLIFLNDDTIVANGWLDNLINTFSSHPNTGLVGSKLVYPDGRLQESGGVIFKDASGNNYGKFKDPLNFQYNYLRNCDYVSGASIAIKKSLFTKIGTFDTRYAPAYYEDTDLAFSVRKAGFNVVYQPLSVVVHLEGATSGTDTRKGYKRFQDINKIKFQKKWLKVLSTHCNSNNALFYATTRLYKGRILFLESSLPEPNKDAGSLREVTMLKILVELGYHITFWPRDLVAKPEYTSSLQQLGIEVAYGSDVHFESFMKDRENMYDTIITARPSTAGYLFVTAKKYQPSAKHIYDSVDLHFLRTRRQYEIEKNPKIIKTSKAWEKLELSIIKASDIAFVVSSEEKKILEKKGFKNIEIVSNIHNNSYDNASFRERSNILFVGSLAHPPNVDGIIWFAKNIFPIIKKSKNDIKLIVAGSGDTELLNEIKNIDGIIIKGFVDDIEQLFHEARVFIAPLRYGAGVKGKIGQSMSLGLPLVSTTIGIEGMHANDGKECYIADDETEFANCVIKLYENENIWRAMQSKSYSIIDKHFSYKNTKAILKSVLS